MTDAGPQDLTRGRDQFVRCVVAALLAAGVADLIPALGGDEDLVVLTGVELHRTDRGRGTSPVIHAFSCSSSLRSRNWTSPQFSRWLGAKRSRAFQSSAYSRKASMRSSTASSK